MKLNVNVSPFFVDTPATSEKKKKTYVPKGPKKKITKEPDDADPRWKGLSHLASDWWGPNVNSNVSLCLPPVATRFYQITRSLGPFFVAYLASSDFALESCKGFKEEILFAVWLFRDYQLHSVVEQVFMGNICIYMRYSNKDEALRGLSKSYTQLNSHVHIVTGPWGPLGDQIPHRCRNKYPSDY